MLFYKLLKNEHGSHIAKLSQFFSDQFDYFIFIFFFFSLAKKGQLVSSVWTCTISHFLALKVRACV